MTKTRDKLFLDYLNGVGDLKTKTLFGSLGVFCDDAIFALLSENKIYIAGGDGFDDELIDLGCQRLKHIKKHSSSLINYYDITDLFCAKSEVVDSLIKKSISLSKHRKAQKGQSQSKRLRGLPNLHLTLERMLKKVGVMNVDAFLMNGPEETFKLLQNHYGQAIDFNVLWKLVGAVESCHWSQVPDALRQQILIKLGLDWQGLDEGKRQRKN